MKTSTITSALALAATVVAAPNYSTYGKGGNGNGKATCACPPNAAQPDGTLGKTYVNTDLLVPISKNLPNVAFPATKTAVVTPNDICTVFNLNLPVAQTQGKICNLVFDFPAQDQALGKFLFYGPGTFQFTGYAIGAGAVAGKTTYKNQPAPGPSPPNPPPIMKPGNSYIVNSAPCGIPAEIPGTVTVSGSLCSPDTVFTFNQGTDGCPLGFFVVLSDA
ncbi:gpi anchored cell wall protein [Colletotrichum karsti]|uniref:Gpi anchored cell wall protein n=1 Tax=Colletotrichum karsti TaxID=1095194 RepID=A0A9P6I1U8_9PEZI|nr:gpi anchored cell wall protein [Colletotrichum karsti]KAF9874237.1 gpi anchored cell wall protein [Colletotrichum karsti]